MRCRRAAPKHCTCHESALANLDKSLFTVTGSDNEAAATKRWTLKVSIDDIDEVICGAEPPRKRQLPGDTAFSRKKHKTRVPSVKAPVSLSIKACVSMSIAKVVASHQLEPAALNSWEQMRGPGKLEGQTEGSGRLVRFTVHALILTLILTLTMTTWPLDARLSRGQVHCFHQLALR